MDTMSDIAMGFAMEHVMVKFRDRRNTSSILQSNFVAGAALGARYGQISWQAQHFQSFCACGSGAVHILDRNVVFSCGASSSSISIILCVCVHVAVCAFWIVRSLRLLRQIPR